MAAKKKREPELKIQSYRVTIPEDIPDYALAARRGKDAKGWAVIGQLKEGESC